MEFLRFGVFRLADFGGDVDLNQTARTQSATSAVGEGQSDSTRCSVPEQSVPNLAKPVDWQKTPDVGEDVHRLHTPLSRLLKQELLKGLVTGSPQEEVGVRTANDSLLHEGRNGSSMRKPGVRLASRAFLLFDRRLQLAHPGFEDLRV